MDTTEWTRGRVLETPATGIGEMPRTDRRDVSRLVGITGGASSAALPPTVHGGVTARLPRGAFTLADLVRWLVLASLVTPPSWRSAPLPAVPYRQMATPPIRIFALSPAQAFRAVNRARYRGPVLPTGHVPAVCQAAPFFPRSGCRNTRQSLPERLHAVRSVTSQ